MKWIAFIDGASSGNPGEAGYGIVLRSNEGKVIIKQGWYIGYATNNVAEYRGLLGCLELAKQYQINELWVYSDSQLLVNQINGTYRVKNSGLKLLHMKAMNIIKNDKIDLTIHHVPREENSEADGLARKAIRLRMDNVEQNESPRHRTGDRSF